MAVEPHIVLIVGAITAGVGLLVLRGLEQRARRTLSQTLVSEIDERASGLMPPERRRSMGRAPEQGDHERQEMTRGKRKCLMLGLLCGTGLWFLMGQFNPVRAVAFIGGGYFVGYAVAAGIERRRKSHLQRELEFFLPLVMERLVMAVHAGLDVVAAIRAVLEHERFGGSKLSPVSALLEQVLTHTEAGLTFEDSLRLVGERVSCPAIRHAFLHLGTAYREGGVLVMPLRELSDATQLYYQETLEEEVARMPVRATVPLVVTFAGLIMIFVAMPLVQVMTMMKRSMPTEVPHVVK